LHVYRWDLDKTYLDTEIESVRGLIRAALEKAREKRNVPGSAALLRALVDHDDKARVCVLSGSPTQMRSVLEEKLALDGIEVHELILKDNLGNIRRGRLRAVTDQLGYKLPHLLQSRVGLGSDVQETLFGDDSEVDALVYAAYAAVVRGDLDAKSLRGLLRAGDAYGDTINAALSAASKIATADAVQGIYIHVDRGVPLHRFNLLAGQVTPVFSWLQAAMALQVAGRLDRSKTIDVIRACTAEAHLSGPQLAGLIQDAVRRGLVPEALVRDLCNDAALEPVSRAILRSLDRLGGRIDPPNSKSTPDYLGFLHAT